MKKILFSFITLVCLVGVIACGNKEKTNNNDTIDDDPTITVKKEWLPVRLRLRSPDGIMKPKEGKFLCRNS